MLTITKNPPPRALEAFKQQQKKAGIEPRYSDFRGDAKLAVQLELLNEQGYLCAYCMKLIDLEVIRIEHWIAQSSDKTNFAHELNYENLLGVCEGKIDFSPNTAHPDHRIHHCERNRDNKTLTIKPTDARLIALVKFTENGAISSEHSDINKDLTETLNLNIQTLKRNRANVWEGVKNGLDIKSRNNKDKKWASAQVEGELQKFSEKRPDENGNLKFREYCGIVLYFLRKRLNRM